MRPMPHGNDFVLDSFFPHTGGVAVDTRRRESTVQTLDVSRRGDGRPSPPYGTFVALDTTKYGINRFFKTAPQIPIPQYPRMERNAVTNPNQLNRLPGYTGNVNVVQTQMGRMIQKDYRGQY